MAEGVSEQPPPGVAVEPVEPVEPAAPVAETAEPLVPRVVTSEESRVYRRRFGVAYLALAVLAGAAVGAAILLQGRPEQQESAWSSWQPTGRESSYDTQVADFVSGRYKHPNGNTLVAVIPSKPQVLTGEGPLPLQAVAIQNDPEGETDDISIVPTENSLMYTLCGLGPRCSIKQGRPSVARMRLLKREALELALYSFKYMDGLSSVITLLPTNIGDPEVPTDDTATALFFEKSDLETELARPLQSTLLSANPPQATEINAVEGLTIDRLTEQRLFTYEFTQTQSGGAVIVLAPVGAR